MPTTEQMACRARQLEPAVRSEDAGFTLIELVAALTVLAIGIVSLVGVVNSAFGVTTRTNKRTAAMNLATLAIEDFRAVPYVNVTPSSTATTHTDTVQG